MRQIQLTRGEIAFVDDADYASLSQHKWYVNKACHIYYAMRWPNVYMHRIILKVPDGLEIDHIDGNGLNNQRSNLRVCTRIQNGQSRRKLMLGNSIYKGVFRDRDRRKWRSRIVVNKKKVNLGSFYLEADAAQAYDLAAVKYHGQFALTNRQLGLL